MLIAALVLCTGFVPSVAKAQATTPDVLVVGGTPAGVAAAVAAARRGETVELVARRAQLGGVLTDAMMDQWDLNLGHDGAPIEAGIFSEIHARLGDSFTPAQAARTFDGIVAREPLIHVVTRAVPIAARTALRNGTAWVTSLTFRDASNGRWFAAGAPYIIDATDNGDVAALAGARYDIGRQDTGRDERMQPVTLMFTVAGVNWPRLQASYDPLRDGFGGVTARRAWGYAKVLRDYRPSAPYIVVSDLNLGHEDGGSVTVNAIDVQGVDGTDEAALQRAKLTGEREAPRLVPWLSRRLPGFEHARLGRFADEMYVRETRHFAGVERLSADNVWDGSIPSDTIGLSSYPIDLHEVMTGDKPAFAPVRHVYGVPFGSLVPRGFGNLILAGPAISASHLASGSARVIPTTIEEGEAAGAATALAAANHLSFSAIAHDRSAIEELRADLARSGVILAEPVQTGARTGISG
jgi:hypothetical protein